MSRKKKAAAYELLDDVNMLVRCISKRFLRKIEGVNSIHSQRESNPADSSHFQAKRSNFECLFSSPTEDSLNYFSSQPITTPEKNNTIISDQELSVCLAEELSGETKRIMQQKLKIYLEIFAEFTSEKLSSFVSLMAIYYDLESFLQSSYSLFVAAARLKTNNDFSETLIKVCFDSLMILKNKQKTNNVC
jgi:hypothetical protein